MIVDGQPRPLHPVLRDEVYRIGREALVNAFRHSGAKSIEMEIEYASSQLRMLVRDNGCGIDPQMLHSGRDGHWGLSGHARAGRANRRQAPCLEQPRGRHRGGTFRPEPSGFPVAFIRPWARMVLALVFA